MFSESNPIFQSNTSLCYSLLLTYILTLLLLFITLKSFIIFFFLFKPLKFFKINLKSDLLSKAFLMDQLHMISLFWTLKNILVFFFSYFGKTTRPKQLREGRIIWNLQPACWHWDNISQPHLDTQPWDRQIMAQLAEQKTLSLSYTQPKCHRSVMLCLSCPAFTWVLGLWTQFLMLEHQSLDPLSHLRSSRVRFSLYI